MHLYFARYESTTQGECEYRDEWDRPDSYTTREFDNEIVSVGENHYRDLTIAYDLVVGEAYYVVAVEWTSGDSFSKSHNGNVAFIHVFRSREAAEACATEIREFTDDDQCIRNLSLQFFDDDGQVIEEGYLPWLGYFETVDSCGVHEMIYEGPAA